MTGIADTEFTPDTPEPVQVVGNRYIVRLFQDRGIIVTADRVRAHKEGNYTARLIVEVVRGSQWARILDVKANLSSLRSRKEIAETLHKAHPFPLETWIGVVERSFQLIVEAVERGEPVVQLRPRPDIEDPPYLIEPIVLEGNITLLYGPGGSGKSLLALWLAVLHENGLSDGVGVNKRGRALYLDWETDQAIAERRLSQIAAMIPTAESFPLYRRCVLPLADDEEALASAVAENNVSLVIIDSAGMACGGDILSAEAAVRFFGSLRRVLAASPGAAALVLSHIAKSERGKDDRMPIGSVYFENIPRMVWEIRSFSDDRSEAIDLLLRCTKSNETARPSPLGFRAVFGPGFISISPSRPPEVLSQEGAAATLVLEALGGGAMTPAQIAEVTGLPSSTVRTVLGRLRDRGKVVQVSYGLWGLKSEES